MATPRKKPPLEDAKLASFTRRAEKYLAHRSVSILRLLTSKSVTNSSNIDLCRLCRLNKNLPNWICRDLPMIFRTEAPISAVLCWGQHPLKGTSCECIFVCHLGQGPSRPTPPLSFANRSRTNFKAQKGRLAPAGALWITKDTLQKKCTDPLQTLIHTKSGIAVHSGTYNSQESCDAWAFKFLASLRANVGSLLSVMRRIS